MFAFALVSRQEIDIGRVVAAAAKILSGACRNLSVKPK